MFFFTRETLAANDKNGTLMKIYTAREDGGFFVIPPPPGCRASDECHGPGSQAPRPALIGTLKNSGGNVPPSEKPKRCGKGKVKRNGKCVPRKKRQRKTHNRGKQQRPLDRPPWLRQRR